MIFQTRLIYLAGETWAVVVMMSADNAASWKCVFSDKGDVFGWGNSEYKQLAMVTDHTQISTPTHLPFSGCGHVIKAVAGGSICAVLNGEWSSVLSSMVSVVSCAVLSGECGHLCCAQW